MYASILFWPRLAEKPKTTDLSQVCQRIHHRSKIQKGDLAEIIKASSRSFGFMVVWNVNRLLPVTTCAGRRRVTFHTSFIGAHWDPLTSKRGGAGSNAISSLISLGTLPGNQSRFLCNEHRLIGLKVSSKFCPLVLSGLIFRRFCEMTQRGQGGPRVDSKGVNNANENVSHWQRQKSDLIIEGNLLCRDLIVVYNEAH